MHFHKAEGTSCSRRYGDQANGKDNALKAAKAMIGKKQYRLNDYQGNYMLRGLTPNHTYTVVIGAKISYTDGKTAELDWTSALQQFLNQDVLKGYYPRSNSYTYDYQTMFSIGYAALPDTYSKDAVLQSYKAALNMAKDSRNYLALNVEDSYSNYKLYDLDPDTA